MEKRKTQVITGEVVMHTFGSRHQSTAVTKSIR